MAHRLCGTVNSQRITSRGEDSMTDLINYRLLDETLDAYYEWREECEAVCFAYRTWSDATGCRKAAAYHDYMAALDNEQHTAEIYADLYNEFIGHVGERASSDLGSPLR
jgi:hypothetical protein